MDKSIVPLDFQSGSYYVLGTAGQARCVETGLSKIWNCHSETVSEILLGIYDLNKQPIKIESCK